MFKRIIMVLAVLSSAIFAGLYAFGQPGEAHNAWNAYQAALRAGDFERAANLVDEEVLAFENETRLLAIRADDADLARLSTLELGYVLGIRQAVADSSLPLTDVLAPESKHAFHASFARARPNKALAESALLAVLPLGPDRSIGWFGPREYAGDISALALSIAFGLRVNFAREGTTGRSDYMPAMSGSAREMDAIGASAKGQAVDVMKRYYNAVLAKGEPAIEQALWTPLNAVAAK